MLASPDIADFGAWAEQLIAESTGKDGKGLIPIDGETPGDPAVYGDDRIFIALRTEGEADAARDAQLAALEIAGHPWCASCCRRSTAAGRRSSVRDGDGGGGRGARHQSVRPAGRRIAKIKTRELTAAFEKTGKQPDEKRWRQPTAWRSSPTRQRSRAAQAAPTAISARG